MADFSNVFSFFDTYVKMSILNNTKTNSVSASIINMILLAVSSYFMYIIKDMFINKSYISLYHYKYTNVWDVFKTKYSIYWSN